MTAAAPLGPVLGIIPARAGSKRLPGKNLRPLGGKPLTAWAIELALGSRELDRCVVSSDDAAVLALAAKYDAALPLERPSELADDHSPAIDYVRHALAQLERDGDRRFEAVVILQPTCPLTRPEDISQTLELLWSTGADSAVTVMEIDHAIHPIKLKTMAGDRLVPFWEEERGRMAREQLPQLFVRNCAVYATRRHVIDAGAIIGDDCRGHIMPRSRSIDINEDIDLAFAEFLLARGEVHR